MRALLVPLGLSLLPVARGALTIDNLEPGELVRHPLIVVRGACSGESLTVGLDKSPGVKTLARGGKYVGLVELKPGVNLVKVACDRESVRLRVDYRPPKTVYRVHAVWYTSSDEGVDYPYEKPGAAQRLNDKLDVALKVLQSFTAEAMRAAGYGRKTFALATDPKGKVIVDVVQSKRSGVELRAADANRTWSEAYDQLKALYPEEVTKFATVMAFSRWDAEKRKATGAFALGGGALAMIYGGTVALWPSAVADVQPTFADATFVDPASSYEDSAGRKTVWANVSTAYGALLHEMGHTFGLPHAADRFAIMSRGFDHLNRRFMDFEPPIHGKPDGATFTEQEIARWDPFEAAQLNLSPWFDPDGPKRDLTNPPTISVEGDRITIRSVRGIGVAGAELDDKPPFFQEFRTGQTPMEIKFSFAELAAKIRSTGAVRVTAIDVDGARSTLEIKPPAKG